MVAQHPKYNHVIACGGCWNFSTPEVACCNFEWSLCSHKSRTICNIHITENGKSYFWFSIFVPLNSASVLTQWTGFILILLTWNIMHLNNSLFHRNKVLRKSLLWNWRNRMINRREKSEQFLCKMSFSEFISEGCPSRWASRWI